MILVYRSDFCFCSQFLQKTLSKISIENIIFSKPKFEISMSLKASSSFPVTDSESFEFSPITDLIRIL